MTTEMSVDEVINLVDENAEKELILKAIKSTLKAAPSNVRSATF
jgi:hypothetical protein